MFGNRIKLLLETVPLNGLSKGVCAVKLSRLSGAAEGIPLIGSSAPIFCVTIRSRAVERNGSTRTYSNKTRECNFELGT